MGDAKTFLSVCIRQMNVEKLKVGHPNLMLGKPNLIRGKVNGKYTQIFDRYSQRDVLSFVF
jgi:hypothetical protein